MKKKLTLKDCTKENFEQSLKLLEDAQRAYREKDLELGERWRDSNYDDRKRINLLDNMLYCGKYSNIPYLSDFLNKTIEFNNINISEKINSWRR